MGTQQDGRTGPWGQVAGGRAPAGDGGQGGPGGAQSPPPRWHLRGNHILTSDTIRTNYVIWTNPRLKPEAQRSRDLFSRFIFLNFTWLPHMSPAFPLSRQPSLSLLPQCGFHSAVSAVCKEPNRTGILEFDFPSAGILVYTSLCIHTSHTQIKTLPSRKNPQMSGRLCPTGISSSSDRATRRTGDGASKRPEAHSKASVSGLRSGYPCIPWGGGEAWEAWETDAAGPRVIMGDGTCTLLVLYPVLCESLGKPPPQSYLVVPMVRGFWEDETGDQPNLVALRGQRCLNKVSLCGLSSCE